ncbi:hypothetical protein ACFL6C_13360 [Myxococcota bacterium]
MWHFANARPDWKTDIDFNAFDWGSYALPFTYRGTSYADLASYSAASGLDANSVQVDKDVCFDSLQLSGAAPAPVPLQVLELQPGCNAVDAGAVLPNMNDSYLGAAPDMGAHEYGGELPQYGPR